MQSICCFNRNDIENVKMILINSTIVMFLGINVPNNVKFKNMGVKNGNFVEISIELKNEIYINWLVIYMYIFKRFQIYSDINRLF